MRILRLLIPHHHQLDHHHQLNKGIAQEEPKDPDHVSEYIHVHSRMLDNNNNNLLYRFQEYSRVRQRRAKIQHTWIQKIMWATIQGHHKIKKTHGDRVHKNKREGKPLQKSSRVSHRRPRSTSPWIQMKTMKNPEMSLEPLHTLSWRSSTTSSSRTSSQFARTNCQCNLWWWRQWVQRWVQCRESGLWKNSTLSRSQRSHWAMTSETHKCAAAAGPFALWLPKMEINRTCAIWLLCRVYNDHCTSMRWPTTSVIWKSKFQKELMVELETCWNSVWRPEEEQQEWELEGDAVQEKKPPCTNGSISQRSTSIS